MNTRTVTRTVSSPASPPAANPQTRGELVAIERPRLPYHDAIGQRFGVDRASWKALVEAIYPAAKSANSVVMALSYCRARNLDPFKRPVHIVPVWDPKGGQDGNGGYVETIWPGISELRTTAFRTGQYAGCDDTEFGPPIKHTFTGEKDRWENRRKVGVDTISITVTFPEWARVTVYRLIGGSRVRFVGPRVYWLESYATQGKLDVPNQMWTDRPVGQIEKCAEAAALRKAFPEEIGNDYAAEEMEGRRVAVDHAPRLPAGPPSPPSPPSLPTMRDVTPPTPGEAIDAETSRDAPPADPPGADDPPDINADPAAALAWIEQTLGSIDDGETLQDVWNTMIEPRLSNAGPGEYEEAMGVYRQHERRLAP